MHPETFLRVLARDGLSRGICSAQSSAADGRYGENPNRLYKHSQFQVIFKPSPVDVQDIYLKSLGAIGINLKEHDIRFEEDNWESPTLGAWGIGWQVSARRSGDHPVHLLSTKRRHRPRSISVELTYGLERICAFLQGVESVYDLRGPLTRPYGDIRLMEEQQFPEYSFDRSDAVSIRSEFELHEKQAKELLDGFRGVEGKDRVRYPLLAAYDHCLKCSHLFNLMMREA